MLKIAFLLIQHSVHTKRLKGFRSFLGKKCIHKITVNLNLLSCSVSFRKFKPYVKQSISTEKLLKLVSEPSITLCHICTRFGHYSFVAVIHVSEHFVYSR